MRLELLSAAIIAVGVAAVALAGIAYSVHTSPVYVRTYAIANGPEYAIVTQSEFDDYQSGGSCLPTSRVTVWDEQREIQFICDL